MKSIAELIAEWALPQAVPEPSAGELSEALQETERKKLTVVTSAISFNVDDLFSTKTAKTTISLPTGVTVRFASGVAARIQDGLKNVAGTIVPKPLELNSTMTLALDLEPYGGDYGSYRFTYVEHKPKKGKPKREVLDRETWCDRCRRPEKIAGDSRAKEIRRARFQTRFRMVRSAVRQRSRSRRADSGFDTFAS